MHSGGIRETLTPCLFYPVVMAKESLEVASALSIPYLIASHATTGEYSYAATYFHIPGLLLERGLVEDVKKNGFKTIHRFKISFK